MLTKLGITALFVASASAACWSQSKGYPCCTKTRDVVTTDADGQWGIENNNWCGIPKEEPKQSATSCWALALGYGCCPSNTAVAYTDESGEWGLVGNEWCGIVKTTAPTKQVAPAAAACWSEKLGFPCCKSTRVVVYSDNDGNWGMENNDWCGIDIDYINSQKTGNTSPQVSTTTVAKVTTTTQKVAAKATYSVIYEAGNRLNTGYDNWGWDSMTSFKDGAMVIKGDPSSYGAASIKNTKGNFGVGGSIRLDVKAAGKVFVKAHFGKDDEEEVTSVGTINGNTDFTTYKFDIEDGFKLDRISIQDGSGEGGTIYVRYLIYSTGSAADFVDPINTNYVPTATTKKAVTNAVYTTIFKTTSSLPNGYENWGWGCTLSYSNGAMVITPKEGDYGAVSLKRVSGTFKDGCLRFDMKNDGTVKVLVENSDKDENVAIGMVQPSDEFKTYIFDIDFGTFDRINFQDSKGTGDKIWLKNLVHSTGSSEDFNDPI